VAFEAIDAEAQPEAWAALRRLGVPALPAVTRGERVVHGWNPQALAELVGVPYAEPPRLAPGELLQRLDRVLAAAERALRQVPPEHLELTHPGRDRTVRQLGYHLFRLSLAFRDAHREGRLPKAWLDEAAPATLADGPAIADYGAGVRCELAAWFAQPEAVTGDIETYYGRQTAHALLERTVWHAAQHLRQLYALLERVGIAPDTPLGDEEWAGLPLPREVW
jgi:hypothetical protein